MANRRFQLTKDHIDLLRASGVSWNEAETGAATIDPKRPYGNSDVERDVAEVLRWKVFGDGPSDEQRDRLLEAHRETETALQILLAFAGEAVLPGWYEQTEPYNRRSWRRVGD